MTPQCLPFSQIPHTTPLFSDFLYDHSKVKQFYPRSAFFGQWMKEQAGLVQYDPARRERVAEILRRQNQGWAASQKTIENIERLRRGANAFVTGQQVGLFSGPLYSIFKALTAAKFAQAATENGVDCVPVFWLATEDHDLDEVSHVWLPGAEGRLSDIKFSANAIADAPVGTIEFSDEIRAAVDAAANFVGDSEITATLRDCYRPGETFGSAFAHLFTKWLAEWGIILLDPTDRDLHELALPIYSAALERAEELDRSLLARGKELESAGYHQQVKVTASSTLVFQIKQGARTSIHRRDKDLIVGGEPVSLPDLLKEVHKTPQEFSGNVLLRPVIQDYLLPTLAYIGGPAEVAYFAQAAVVYQTLLGRVTPIVPRFSATLIEQKPGAILQKFGLNFTDLFRAEPIREQLGAKALSNDVQSAFDAAQVSTKKSLIEIRKTLEKLDKTLVDAANNAEAKMLHQLESLQARSARAQLLHSEVLDRKAAYLSNMLYPHKELQEREIGGLYFVSRYGLGLLGEIYKWVRPDCVDHQLISL